MPPHRRLLRHDTLIPVFLALMLAGSLRAQDPAVSPDEVSVARPIAASLGLGVVGFHGGGLLGALAGSDCTSGDQCELGNAVVMGMIGITAGSALGAHPGNRQHGSLGMDVLASGSAMVGGLLLTNLLADDNGSPVLLIVPIAQVVAAVTTERKTGRKGSSRVQVAAMPGGGRAGLFMRIRA